MAIAPKTANEPEKKLFVYTYPSGDSSCGTMSHSGPGVCSKTVSMAATTQGCMDHDSPLLAKLINAMVDTVGEGVAEGVVGGLGLDTNGEELKENVRSLFAIFC